MSRTDADALRNAGWERTHAPAVQVHGTYHHAAPHYSPPPRHLRDRDGDGVANRDDDFPNNPNRS